MSHRGLLAAALTLGATIVATTSPAQATERHFTYSYETGTLPAGGREFELWTTARVGRERLYTRFENRAEFEYGLTDRLQTAFYLNTKSLVQDKGDEVTSEYEFTGVSSEWKYKLSDSVADTLGSALYGEFSIGPEELELELKLLLDKRVGPWLFAGNLVYEYEVEHLGSENEVEKKNELDLAVAHFITPQISLGLEVRAHGEYEDELEDIAVYAGPVAAWSSKSVWAAFTVLGQVGAFHLEEGGFERDLKHHERLNVRLLLGTHL